MTALVLATPLFGLGLFQPAPLPAAPSGSLLRMPVMLQVGAGEPSGEVPEEQAPGEPEAVEAPAETPAAPTPEEAARAEVAQTATAQADSAAEMRRFADEIRHRQQIADVHRVFGIATWSSMLLTGVLGFIQYFNHYGFFASRDSTPCVTGSAVFGQDQCWGTSWVHRVSAIATTALYGTTFSLSLLMPDPNHADQGSSAFADHLRTHKVLRWVHFGGMLAQIFLGLAIGQNWFGLDRANDYGALQALATVHQLIGWGTFGVLTAAGALMVF
ncbi:MAG: hypothetical protein IT378_24130 [Sandaracinaceae bacterium]|nr:hypothetical protein [Sandaracinaceae bacterium]